MQSVSVRFGIFISFHKKICHRLVTEIALHDAISKAYVAYVGAVIHHCMLF